MREAREGLARFMVPKSELVTSSGGVSSRPFGFLDFPLWLLSWLLWSGELLASCSKPPMSWRVEEWVTCCTCCSSQGWEEMDSMSLSIISSWEESGTMLWQGDWSGREWAGPERQRMGTVFAV